MPFRMSGRGQETLPDVQEWPRVVGRPSRMSGVVGRPSRRSGSGRKALPDNREGSGGTPGCPGVVGRPSWMSESGREALPDIREWSGVPPKCS